MARGAAWTALVVLAGLSAGCLRATLERELRNEPVPPEALAALAPGADLGACLDALGAPLWVWERDEDGREGAALAYGWYDERAWGMRVSVPLHRAYSPYVDYDRVGRRMRGVVLFFDADWRLVTWRTGLLRDLTYDLGRRPVDVDGDAADGG